MATNLFLSVVMIITTTWLLVVKYRHLALIALEKPNIPIAISEPSSVTDSPIVTLRGELPLNQLMMLVMSLSPAHSQWPW